MAVSYRKLWHVLVCKKRLAESCFTSQGEYPWRGDFYNLTIQRGDYGTMKSEQMHDFYTACKDINFDETSELFKNAESKEEKDFIRVVTDFVLQQKQKQVIKENRF